MGGSLQMISSTKDYLAAKRWFDLPGSLGACGCFHKPIWTISSFFPRNLAPFSKSWTKGAWTVPVVFHRLVGVLGLLRIPKWGSGWARRLHCASGIGRFLGVYPFWLCLEVLIVLIQDLARGCRIWCLGIAHRTFLSYFIPESESLAIHNLQQEDS